MGAIFSYSSDRIVCPYPSCEKGIEVELMFSTNKQNHALICPHCKKEFTVKIDRFMTETPEQFFLTLPTE